MTQNASSSLDTNVLRINPDGGSRIVLICEHASPFIPAQYAGLGLSDADRESHAVWDPGALAIAERLSDALDAKLVASGVSRLVYDCNRPPEAASAMPEQSELIAVPGNANLSESERAQRTARFYTPFHEAVTDALAHTDAPILVTIHSFTPVFHGQQREVEIGVLHDDDRRLADLMLRNAAAHTSTPPQRNAPYGPQDGVTHTLREHGVMYGYPNVMLEIRNDLIASREDQTRMARMLASWLTQSCRDLIKPEAHA